MLANILKNLRMSRKISQIELAKILNVHQTAISQWENGRTHPDHETLQLLATYFDVSIDYLLGRDNSLTNQHSSIRVPVFGTIPAGIPIAAIQDIEDYEEIPATSANLQKDYFALKVRGDSMSPTYLDGDIVIFAVQDTCESGQDCAVMVNGDEATFKRVRISSHGITLQPLNPAYEPIAFTNKEVQSAPVSIIGVAREIRRKIP